MKSDKPTDWPANRPAKPYDLRDFSDRDRAAGFEVDDSFEPFSQRNDMFMRAWWDPEVASDDARAFFESYRMDASPRKGEGFNQRDFALRNAAWTVADDYADRSQGEGKREGFSAPLKARMPKFAEAADLESPESSANEIKRIARLFGADLVGITDYDPRWTYQDRVDVRDMSSVDNPLPSTIRHVIVLGHGMDHDLVQTYPSALAGAAVGIGYSKEAGTAQQMAQYILNMGYEAVASMNDTSLVIPYAVQAGLGEYGRNQMVITPEFGPRVRFSKIFTDMPLAIDQPRRFGVREFCDICDLCAQACPPQALPYGPPTATPVNRSTLKGVKKWSADCEKCFGYWAKLKSDCAICMRVCPWNQKPDGLKHKLFRALASGAGRHLALRLHQYWKNEQRLRPKDWWQKVWSPDD